MSTARREVVLDNLRGFLSDPPEELAEHGRQIMIVKCLEIFAGCRSAEVAPLKRDGLGLIIPRVGRKNCVNK